MSAIEIAVIIALPLIVWMLAILVILTLRFHTCILAKATDMAEIYKEAISKDLSSSISIMVFIYMAIAAMLNEYVLIGILFIWLSFKAYLWFRGKKKQVNNDD